MNRNERREFARQEAKNKQNNLSHSLNHIKHEILFEGRPREERRQQERLLMKNDKKEFYSNMKNLTETILEKINNGSELNEKESSIIMQIFRPIYIFRNEPKSSIIGKLNPKESYKEITPREGYLALESFVEVFFELINPLIEEEKPLGQKIIAYWDNEQKKYYESEEGELELKQKYDTISEVGTKYKFSDEPMSFEEFKEDAKNSSIKDINIKENIPYEERQIFEEYGIEVLGKKETKIEEMERNHANSNHRDSQLKFVLDNLPDFETYLEYMNDNSENLDDEKFCASLAVSDMAKYIEDPNLFKDRPNFVKFLEALKNSKHPTIEDLIGFLKYLKQQHQNPVKLNKDKSFPSEQKHRKPYRKDPSKR